MKSSKCRFTWFIVAATVAVFFGLAVRNASAGDPVPGIDISLEEIPGGIVTKGVTGADGVARFPGLATGTYRVVLDNVTKVATVGHKTVGELKNATPPTEPGLEGSSSAPNVTIGIGSIFGSGSTKRSPNERVDGSGSSGSASAGGGIGINIPLSSGEVWNQPSRSAVGSIPIVGGNLSFRSTATAAAKEKIKGPNAVNVKLALRDKSSKTIIAKTTADDMGNFKFVETPINIGKATTLEIGIDIPGVTAGFQYCTLPADPAPGLPLMEECDPGGPVFLNVWTCYNLPCPWEKEEGVSAKRKAQKEQAEADAAKRQEGEVGNRPTQAFNPSEIVIKKEEGVKRAPDRTDAGGGTILWTTLVNGRTASFIPRSACDIKDGMEAALVIVGDEPQFAVRISQTPYLPQGVTIQCGGGDPLGGLNIGSSHGGKGGSLCP
ncbi:MAG: carboxypeptidase regulatory-like domain-containing protein [Deltaproteobacteria bacterium]|nr:carboxypeptidase regulatory-like domain-containing protein [Deltaproteobacteria bacterium]